MGLHYEQLSLEERCSIAQWHAAGQSTRQIASALGRSPSSISRELKRNSGSKVGYKPSYAHEQAKARRWRGSRLARQPTLRAYVLDRLAMGWSPTQVAGRLALENNSARISHESIYRFIYAQKRRTDDGAWRHYLPRAKSKRGWRSRPSASPVDTIKNRVCVEERPRAAKNRKQAGHWEADLMLFRTYGQALVVAHERKSRFTVFLPQFNKTSKATRDTLESFFDHVPAGLKKTLTFDNGTEFALHGDLAKTQGFATFFCKPHAPWQKGGIENSIGRMRRMLPTKTDLNTLKTKDILNRTAVYNHTPRKCLDFKTPAEVFSQMLLHFKCDSTRWPKAG